MASMGKVRNGCVSAEMTQMCNINPIATVGTAGVWDEAVDSGEPRSSMHRGCIFQRGTLSNYNCVLIIWNTIGLPRWC